MRGVPIRTVQELRRMSDRIGVRCATEALKVAEGTFTRAAIGAPVNRTTASHLRAHLETIVEV